MAAALAALGLPALPRPAQQADAQEPQAAHRAGARRGRRIDDGISETAADEDPDGAPGRARPDAAPPMAAHFAPLDERSLFCRGRLGMRRAWSAGDPPPTVVWGAGSLVPNLIAVLERRLIEASTRGLEDKPLAGATGARLSDVAAFLSVRLRRRTLRRVAGRPGVGATGATQIGVRAGPALRPFRSPTPRSSPCSRPTPHSAPSAVLPAAARLPVPPGLIARLRAGGDSRDGRGYRRRRTAGPRRAPAHPACQRRSPPRAPARGGSASEAGRMGAGVPADRLAAALLMPIDARDLSVLIERAYPGAPTDDDHVTTEDTTHGA